MSHLMKFTEWQSAGTGEWHTGDLSDLAHGSNYWWNVPRMLNISLTEYILLLKDKFNAFNFRYNSKTNVLFWSWPSYADCHSFTIFVNKEARKRKFFI